MAETGYFRRYGTEQSILTYLYLRLKLSPVIVFKHDGEFDHMVLHRTGVQWGIRYENVISMKALASTTSTMS